MPPLLADFIHSSDCKLICEKSLTLPSGAEKAYKSAIRKLKRHLHGGDYGAWLDIQRTLREAQREAGREAEYGSPQATWLEERELIRGFLCKTAALCRVFLVLCAADKDGQIE